MECNNNNCPCKRTKCERHGNCASCKEYHNLSKKKFFTTCERLKEKEREKRKNNKNL